MCVCMCVCAYVCMYHMLVSLMRYTYSCLKLYKRIKMQRFHMRIPRFTQTVDVCESDTNQTDDPRDTHTHTYTHMHKYTHMCIDVIFLMWCDCTCRPSSRAWKTALMATSVFPNPTSPQMRRSIGMSRSHMSESTCLKACRDWRKRRGDGGALTSQLVSSIFFFIVEKKCE